MADDVEDRGKVRLCAAYVGADSETVDWMTYRPSPDGVSLISLANINFAPIPFPLGAGDVLSPVSMDDGSAVHEPAPEAWQSHIYGLTVRNEQLARELRMALEKLARLPEEAAGETVATDDPVKADIERTIDHLQHERVSPKLRGDLRRATDQAERVKPGANDAVWKARR